MKCPKCQFENLKKAKFCIECGYRLVLPLEVPTNEISLDEKLEKIQRYLPRGIVNKILSHKDKIEGDHVLGDQFRCAGDRLFFH